MFNLIKELEISHEITIRHRFTLRRFSGLSECHYEASIRAYRKTVEGILVRLFPFCKIDMELAYEDECSPIVSDKSIEPGSHWELFKENSPMEAEEHHRLVETIETQIAEFKGLYRLRRVTAQEARLAFGGVIRGALAKTSLHVGLMTFTFVSVGNFCVLIHPQSEAAVTIESSFYPPNSPGGCKSWEEFWEKVAARINRILVNY